MEYSNKSAIVRLGSFGIMGLQVKAQSIGSFIDPIVNICSNDKSEYQAVVDELNNALIRVAPTVSTVFYESFQPTC